MQHESMERQLEIAAQHIDEQAPLSLSQRSKANIPNPIHRDHDGKISIIVHLRISRLTAVAAILATVVGCAYLFGGWGEQERDLYGDFKALVHFLPGVGADRASTLAGFQGYYEKLVQEGYDTVYFGDIVDPQNPTDMLMYWQLADGSYRVIFADFRNATVDSKGLIWLQACMLRDHRDK